MKRMLSRIAGLCTSLMLGGCFGGIGGSTFHFSLYQLNGNVSGLTGCELVLRNGTDKSGPFLCGMNGSTLLLPQLYSPGTAYDVTVDTQPTTPSQTCVVANGVGVIGSADVTNIQVTCTTDKHVVGGTVTGLIGSGLVLSDNGADELGVSADGKFAFRSAVASGASYSVAVVSQPSAPAQRCTITNGAGTVTAADVTTVAVACLPVGRFAYVTTQATSSNSGANAVAAYGIDPASGVLTALAGSPYSTGVLPTTAAVDPRGQFLYVVSSFQNGVWAYTIDTVTGKLTAVTGSPFATGASPYSVTVDPNGTHAYVTNNSSGTVSAYTISSASGALTAVTGSPFAAGQSPESIAVDPHGTCAYTANADGTVSAYSIDVASGGLASVPGSPFSAGTIPVAVAVDPTGRFTFVANLGAPASISAFSIDSTSGVLTPVAGSPFASAVRIGSIAVEPNGRHAYVTNYFDNTVTIYEIDTTTVGLTAVAGPPSATGRGPRWIALDPSGTFAYVTNGGENTVSEYTIDATSGALTPIAGSPIAVNAEPGFIVISK